MKLFFLLIILVSAAFLRFYKLSEYPIHLGHDEVTQLYDAISVAETGKDIYGNPYPFIFRSVNDFKPPFYTYATALLYPIFGWREITVRITGAFFGTLLVLGVYYFSKEFLKKEGIALTAAILTAISPFEIFYSRKSFENQTGVFLMFVGFAFLLSYIRRKKIKFFYLGALSLGISAYIYFAQAVLVPILIFVFFLIFWKKLRPFKIWPFVFFLAIIAPLFYMILTNSDVRNRASAVSIRQDPRLGEKLEGKSGVYRTTTVLSYAVVRYFKQFDPKYLFFEGLNMTEGKRDVGVLFPAQIPFLLVGAYLMIKEKLLLKERLFIFVWILVGMIPSGLTFENFSPHRALMTFTMLNVVTSFGIFWFYRRFGQIALFLLVILFGLNFIFFVKRYTVNYPIERSEALHYPYRDVALYAWENYGNYEKIVFDPKFGEFAPWIGTGAHYYLAFYGKYQPERFQKEFTIGDQSKRETKFGKFSIRAVFWPEDKSLKDTLIIASVWSLPVNVKDEAKIIKTFYFKTTAPAFYAIKL